MTLLACAAVRRRLQAFYDRELHVGDQIAVEAHVHECPPCARHLREFQLVGEALRLAGAPGPSDDWTGLRPGVVSRMRRVLCCTKCVARITGSPSAITMIDPGKTQLGSPMAMTEAFATIGTRTAAAP